MPLVELPLQLSSSALPMDVADFIRDAEGRIAQYQRQGDKKRIPGFISGNFHIAFRALRELVDSRPASEMTFCEWGSGFGVITCLARRLGFRACGIEIEPDLVWGARQLASDYKIDVSYFEGSYKPEGIHEETVDEHRLHEELGFRPMDFNLISIYPWPAEEKVVSMLIERFAHSGTLLMTYHGGGRMRLRKKAE